MARFDWYQATVHGPTDKVLEDVGSSLLRAFDLSDLTPTSPLNGYTHGAAVRRGDTVLATMFWGGNPGVNVKGTGEDSVRVSKALRSLPYRHRVTRVDSCVDWIESGLFDRLALPLIKFALELDIHINQQGDWERGQARTLYLGSPSSTVRLVLYEKGYESGGDPDWVRMEARVRPKGDRGYKVASWTPGNVFQASRWMVKALERVGWDGLIVNSVGTVRRPSDIDRSKAAMIRQYRKVIMAWADQAGGWEELGRELMLECEAAGDGQSAARSRARLGVA